MNKLNKIFPAGYKIPPTFNNVQENSTEVALREQATLKEEKPTSELFLRDKILAIQSTKRELGIQNQAAVILGGVGEAVIGAAVGWAAGELLRYCLKKGVDSSLDQSASEAMKALDKYWNDDLTNINESDRNKAIKELASASLNEPQKIVSKVEVAIDKYLSSNQDLSDDESTRNIRSQTIRAFFAALEALYQRTDVTIQGNPPFYEKFVGYLEKPHTLIDRASKRHIRRILVGNWKIPVNGYKVPNPDRQSGEHRIKMYEAILETLIDLKTNKLTDEDPLYLRTPLYNVPSDLQQKVEEFRKALVKAHRDEVELGKIDETKFDPTASGNIEKVLAYSSEIPPEEWDQKAKELLRKRAEIEERFIRFNEWAFPIVGMGKSELQKCFDSLTYFPQQKTLGLLEGEEDNNFLKKLYYTNVYNSVADLNKQFVDLLKFLKIDTEDETQKLTYDNSEKGMFFFRFLNELVEKKVQAGDGIERPFKNYLWQDNKELLLSSCRKVIHDRTRFPQIARDEGFFLEPPVELVPGQALALYHKLTRHFSSDGYVDVYGLRNRVVKNAVDNFSFRGTKGISVNSGFIFSGPPGTGKSSFAESLANQLAVPLYTLTPSKIIFKEKGLGIKISHDGQEISLGRFFEKVNADTPCVLLLDEVDQYLMPREVDYKCQLVGDTPSDNAEDNTITSAFLTDIQNIRKDGQPSKVILIMTTNFPPTGRVNTSLIDKDGFSSEAQIELYRNVSYGAIRPQRVDFKIFSFHKLFNQEQGEAFARRFLTPYVESGKIVEQIDYAKAGEEIKDYTPADIQTAFSSVANGTPETVALEQMLNQLKKHTSRPSLVSDSELERKLYSKIDSLVNVDQVKQLKGKLDFVQLAIAAKGLSGKQIAIALQQYTPETLTQENIIAAFEQVRKPDTSF